MADYVGLETTGHVLLEDGSGLLLEVQPAFSVVIGAASLMGSGTLLALPRRVHNVTIPQLPLVQLVCSPSVICGTGHLCGEITTGDRYYEWLLDLDGGHGEVFWQTNVTVVVASDVLLELDGANVTLTLQTVIRPTDAVLELDGGEARVNPILMPDECFDIELAEILCTPLDLAVISVGEIALEPALAVVLIAPPTSPEDA